MTATTSVPTPLSTEQQRTLDAMDIQVWVQRDAVGVSEPATVIDDGNLQSSDVDSTVWGRLESEVSGCTQCPLHQSRTQTVFGVGNQSEEPVSF